MAFILRSCRLLLLLLLLLMQTYQASGLLWQLLSLQLMASDCDMLTELKGQSAADINKGLAAHTHAAVSGMVPVFAAAAQVAGVHLNHSSSSCGGGSSNGTASAPHQRGSSGSGSGGSSGGRHSEAAGGADSTPHLSLLHMTAQLDCCLPAAPQDALPWLQLLSKFHALSSGVAAQHAAAVSSSKYASWQPSGDASTSSDDEAEQSKQFDPSVEPQGRLAAMAVALQSCAVPLPPAAVLLCRAVQERYADMDNVPVLA
jgi:hypothetical protein